MDDSPMNSALRLDVQDLSFSRDGASILRGITIGLARAETLALIGKSGSGKTSLLRCLALFNTPSHGDIVLDGNVLVKGGKVKSPPWNVRRKVALVSQDYALIPNLTGVENITVGLIQVRGQKRAAAENFAIHLGEEFGLPSELLRRHPASYSGGQAQRVALIRALALKPKVLLLDEITSALDPETVAAMVESVSKIRDDHDYDEMSIVIVTHLMQFARDFSDRIAFMHQGALVEEGPADTFFVSAKTPCVTEFLSRSRLPY